MFNYFASNISSSPLIDELLRSELGAMTKNNGSKSKKFPVLVKFKQGDACYQSGTQILQNIVNKNAGCEIKRSLPRFSLQSGNFTAEALEALCTDCGNVDVEKVYLDRQYKALLDVATDTTRASELKEESDATGEGVNVALIDTGVYPSPDLMDPEERIIGFKDFVNGQKDPYDDNGHGTHCAGDVAGNGQQSDGKYAGPAPNSNIIGVKVLDSMGSGSLSDIIAGVDWCIENKDEYNIHILSLSLGSSATSPEDDDPMVQSVNKAWDEGIVVCAAAGNEGPSEETISSPGISQKIITVGALDDRGSSDQSGVEVAEFSSRGPTIDGHKKPDILAPGVDIVSLRAPNSNIEKSVKSKILNENYVALSGTSMATPICAGVCAQLLQLNDELTPQELKEQLFNQAEDLGLDENTQGKGSLDAVGNSDEEE